MTTTRPNTPNVQPYERPGADSNNTHAPPVAYFSPFVPRVPSIRGRPAPILIPQQRGPVPILPRGLFLAPMVAPVKNSQEEERQPEARKRLLSTKISLCKGKKARTETSHTVSNVPDDDVYAQVACIAQHPSPLLLPGKCPLFTLPNVADDSVVQQFPVETLQTIDVLEIFSEEGEQQHTGNQMFHLLISSYRPVYNSLSNQHQELLIRNLTAFLRLQGVRFLMRPAENGPRYECGNERLKRRIQAVLSCCEDIY